MTKKRTSKVKHEIELFTSQTEYLCMKISKEKFIEYRDVGMSNDDYFDFECSSDYCDAIYDELTSLTVDDEEIKDFNSFMDSAYANFIKQLDEELQGKTAPKNKRISYAVIGEKWIKRSWYRATINEEFDISKLKVQFCRNRHFDDTFRDTFNLYYGEQEIEFSESNDSNYDEEYLATSKGERFDFTQVD